MTAALPYLVAAVALAATSQILLRRGMRSLTGAGGLGRTLLHALRSPAAWAGSCGYVAAMACWLEVLGRAEIALVYPVFTGATTILVLAASVVALGERLEWRRVIGAGLMIAGIFVAYLE